MEYYNPYQQQIPYPYIPNPAQRLQQLEQRYPQFSQPSQPVNQSQSSGLPCTVVTCVDEAKSAQVALDGTPNLFLDTSKEYVYLKQINLNGTADFLTFKKYVKENNDEEEIVVDKLTKEDFNSRMDALKLDVKELTDYIKKVMEWLVNGYEYKSTEINADDDE